MQVTPCTRTLGRLDPRSSPRADCQLQRLQLEGDALSPSRRPGRLSGRALALRLEAQSPNAFDGSYSACACVAEHRCQGSGTDRRWRSQVTGTAGSQERAHRSQVFPSPKLPNAHTSTAEWERTNCFSGGTGTLAEYPPLPAPGRP